MYNNTGAKIKDKAQSLCRIKMFFNIALAFILFVFFIYLSKIPVAEFPDWLPYWSPLVILALVIYYGLYKPLSAWNQYLLYAGCGELIEETTKSATQLEEIKKILLSANPVNNHIKKTTNKQVNETNSSFNNN